MDPLRRGRLLVAPAVIAAGCLAGLVVAAGDVAAAGVRAGMVVTSLSAPPSTAPAGSAFSLRDTTRNFGRRPRGAWTVYLASRRPGPAPGQMLLGARRVDRLGPGRVSRASTQVLIPVRARANLYWLFACTASRRRPNLRQLDAASCKIAPRRIRIVPAAPRSVGAPRITGHARDGSVLRAGVGRWSGLPPIVYTRRWRRCDRAGKRCADIRGATAASYTVTPADVGRTIRLAVVATNPQGRRGAQSSPTVQVRPAPPANRRSPAVVGRTVAGETVTADPGAWAGTPPLAMSYQWQQCDRSRCADIPGADARSHTLAAAIVGRTLRVVVRARNRVGAAVARSAAVPTGMFQNPVAADAAAPDPFVLDEGHAHSSYWEFNTGARFPIRHSTDLIHWTPAGTALTIRPGWVAAGDWDPWAPSVLPTAGPCPGAATGPCYVLYYVGLSRQWGVHCVAVATAANPGGPYTDLGPLQLPLQDPSEEPVGCGDPAGQGNIDPSPFVDDDGNAYLYTRTDRVMADGASSVQPTISVFPLSPDRLHASGPRSALFSGDGATWEGVGTAVPIVENPAMVKHDGTYYLMYSGGSWLDAYGMGYAVSSSPVAGFAKAERLLVETTNTLSPGGGDIPVTGPNGGTWLAYHGRDLNRRNPRTLRIDRFSWRPGAPDVPVVTGPTSRPVTEAP